MVRVAHFRAESNSMKPAAQVFLMASVVWLGAFGVEASAESESAAGGQRRVIQVASDSEFRQAVRSARPGTVIRIRPGQYTGGVWISNLHGQPGAPIVIEAADPNDPPVFVGEDTGWQLDEASHVLIRHVRFRRQRANGLNIDDGGSFETPATSYPPGTSGGGRCGAERQFRRDPALRCDRL